jgi:hypothetical protein
MIASQNYDNGAIRIRESADGSPVRTIPNCPDVEYFEFTKGGGGADYRSVFSRRGCFHHLGFRLDGSRIRQATRITGQRLAGLRTVGLLHRSTTRAGANQLADW